MLRADTSLKNTKTRRQIKKVFLFYFLVQFETIQTQTNPLNKIGQKKCTAVRKEILLHLKKPRDPQNQTLR
eukprot:c44232_g1_i1 orf=7-219(-)